MTIFSLLIWQVLGILLGAALAAKWKIRGLSLAWGMASGGVGGVVGGILCRMVLPDGILFDGLAVVAAVVSAVAALLIARASVVNRHSGTA